MPILITKNYKDFEIHNDTTNSEVLVSFSGYKQANRCLPGDEVEWDGTMCSLIKRADHSKLVGTLEMKSKSFFGHTSRGHKIYLFHPFHTGYPPMRVASSDRNTISNKLIMVQFQEWETYELMPRGNSVRVFGDCGDLKAEMLALQWHYGFPQHNKAYFEIACDTITKEALAHRVELAGYTINIDPDGCHDIDDCITFNQKNLDEWEVVITIADVAEYIQENSMVDNFAKEKGQTLYQNGAAVVPMLPSYLSENALSLLPGFSRCGVSLFCIWNEKTQTLQADHFALTQITNQKTYTYETIYQATEIPVDILQRIASSLKGCMTEDSHEWVEELMLLYNKEAAKLLLSKKIGLLRTHTAANAEKLAAYEAIHPDLRILAFTSAKYAPTDNGLVHATLGSVPYAHASSPLRRYADLVNQRALKAILNAIPCASISDMLASHLNFTQKQQKHHDRDLYFLTQIVKSNVGKKSAIVIVSTETKTKVYVPAWKRIVSVKTQTPLHPKQEVNLEYYADLQKPRWDERMVFRLQPMA